MTKSQQDLGGVDIELGRPKQAPGKLSLRLRSFHANSQTATAWKDAHNAASIAMWWAHYTWFGSWPTATRSGKPRAMTWRSITKGVIGYPVRSRTPST